MFLWQHLASFSQEAGEGLQNGVSRRLIQKVWCWLANEPLQNIVNGYGGVRFSQEIMT